MANFRSNLRGAVMYTVFLIAGCFAAHDANFIRLDELTGEEVQNLIDICKRQNQDYDIVVRPYTIEEEEG